MAACGGCRTQGVTDVMGGALGRLDLETFSAGIGARQPIGQRYRAVVGSMVGAPRLAPDCSLAEMRSAFGDLFLDWTGQRVRRGDGGWKPVEDSTADILLELMRADGLSLSGETLWRALPDRIKPFSGRELATMISSANSVLIECDAELIIEAFTVRLVDITPRPFLRKLA
jgi:hypothetical protein